MKPNDAQKQLVKRQDLGQRLITEDALGTLSKLGHEPSKFALVVKEAIARLPNVYKANMAQFGRAIQACARDGLVPDGYQSAIIVAKTGAVKYLPMEGGLKMAARRALGAEIHTGHIREQDEWDLKLIPGEAPQIYVKPALELDDRGPVIASYAWTKLKNGDIYFRFLDRGELAMARAQSTVRDGGIWKKWPARAAEKSAGKSLMHSLRYIWMDNENSEQLATILENDSDYNQDGNSPGSDADPEIIDAEFEEIYPEAGETTVEEEPQSTQAEAPKQASPPPPPPPSTEKAEEKPKPARKPKAGRKQSQEKSESTAPSPPPPSPPPPPPPAAKPKKGNVEIPF